MSLDRERVAALRDEIRDVFRGKKQVDDRAFLRLFAEAADLFHEALGVTVECGALVVEHSDETCPEDDTCDCDGLADLRRATAVFRLARNEAHDRLRAAKGGT